VDHKPVEGRRVERVTTGKVITKKKSLYKQFTESFLGDDTKTVGEYIIHDVMVPALKSMISEAIGGGIEVLLFGEKRGRNMYRDRAGRSHHVSYGSYFKEDKGPGSNRRDISRTSRAKHDFDEIVLPDRGEAEMVLSHLVDLTLDYGQATVADLYDLVGITPDFTDYKYGWVDLRNASVSRVRDGYLVNLPRTIILD